MSDNDRLAGYVTKGMMGTTYISEGNITCIINIHYLCHRLAWIRCQDLDIQVVVVVVVVDIVSLPFLVVEVHCHRVVVVILEDNLEVVVAVVVVRMDSLLVMETVRDILLVIRRGFGCQRLMQSISPMSLQSSTYCNKCFFVVLVCSCCCGLFVPQKSCG